MKKKLRIGILFGGRSGEHEVSLRSARSILAAIDRKKYDVVAIGIDKTGRWLTDGAAQQMLAGEPPADALGTRHLHDHTENPVEDDPEFASVAAVLRSGEALSIPKMQPPPIQAIPLSASAELAQPTGTLAQSLDVVFPVLHGTFGEDGTIQGLLELADVPYVGSGVLGSATGMDKDFMKKLFAAADLPQTPYVTLTRMAWKQDPKHCQKQIEKKLSYPVFVKPANLGSSVGISKVHDATELAAAMDLAASFDRKLVIEEGVGGPGVKPRELEVAVLGNESPEASVVGEIVPNKEFYDYQSKYSDSPEDPSIPIVPADLRKSEQKKIRAMALAAFQACDCAGLARVDFLMEPARKGHKARIFLNEINTMPGFTSISMYPKLWEASGLKYRDLIDRLIVLARERHKEKSETAFTLP